MSKLRIGVIFGGRSGEHEVSLMSAKSIMSAMDPKKYDIIPIGLTKQGKWRLLGSDAVKQIDTEIPDFELDTELLPLELLPDPTISQGFDVIFPVLHGTFGEDGTIQGFLEMANIPYVGAGVASSAVSMDKGMMRVLFNDAGLPLVPWLTILRHAWEDRPEEVVQQIETELGYPCFVKPANLGSSVGISKAKDRAQLEQAMNLAASFDRKLVIEQALMDIKEVECSVLGNEHPIVSIPGEIVPGNEFYDYDAKYLQDNSELIIPANISEEQKRLVQDYALKAYQAVDCAGMARLDFFVTSRGEVVLNEINTIPGFTRISMYPKLWEESGITYSELVDRLIELAIERHKDRNRSRTSR